MGAGDVQHALEEVGNRMQASLEQQRNTAMLNIGVGASLDLAEGTLHPHVSGAGPALGPSRQTAPWRARGCSLSSARCLCGCMAHLAVWTAGMPALPLHGMWK